MAESEDIAPSLRVIKNLLALHLVKDLKGDDQVELLARAGLSGAEISEILGKEYNAIRQAIFRLNKQGKLHTEKSQKNK